MNNKFYILLFAFFLTAAQLYANVITVKGYVKQANGKAAANSEVKLETYFAGSATSCNVQVTTTNNDGFYSKEISCQGGDIRKSKISIKNCDGTLLTLVKEVPSTKVVEANFIVCAPPPVCMAKFTLETVPASSAIAAFSVRFNSSPSEVGSGDQVIGRAWDFHDGSPQIINRVDPLHTFPRAGTYEVCHNIKTALGCESRVCMQVVVPPNPQVACAAKFNFEKIAPKKFRFTSAISVTDADDHIVSRKWDFRDGTISNDIAPSHEFAKPGNYEVCLYIKTAKGCESKVCALVKVEDVAVTNNPPIEIISLYPTPAHESLKAVVFSRHANVIATISIVDAYGIVQISKKMTLIEGKNFIGIPVSHLVAGSYFIKISTQHGTISKAFYKV